MFLAIAGKIVIGIEILLLLAWAYSMFLKPNGTDPAGQGIAAGMLMGFAAYIAIQVFLLLSGKTWAAVMLLIMAAIPICIVTVMLMKEYQANRGR